MTLTTAGTDTGPFNLYSDVDGYISAFEVGVPKIDLVAGYTSYVVPNGTTMVRIMSAGTCKNYIDLPAITTKKPNLSPSVCQKCPHLSHHRPNHRQGNQKTLPEQSLWNLCTLGLLAKR